MGAERVARDEYDAGGGSRMADRPRDDERASWRTYWAARGMPWRAEPEISTERQAFLAERRAVTPDPDEGVYPFRDLALSRADVEWLLETHENKGGRGPVVWAEEREKEPKERRTGLDVRGADLRGVDLSGLPLTRLNGGLVKSAMGSKTEAELASGAHFEGANLRGAHLENSALYFTHFNGADLSEASCEWAGFTLADLRDANFTGADLSEARALAAHVERANFTRARAKKLTLMDCFLQGASFREADLEGADLRYAGLEQTDLRGANLRGARFLMIFGQGMPGARLEGADLTGAEVAEADFWGATFFDEGELGVAVPRPADEDAAAWRRYWWGQGLRWRTEPEIAPERQAALAERRRIEADPAQGRYPFKEMEPALTRGDIEWLLATHEDGRGSVEYGDASQRGRWGLDLRGAALEKLNLTDLPLARARFGLTPEEAAPLGFPNPENPSSRSNPPLETKLTGADLRGAHLEGAVLDLADCGNARMTGAHLRAATLRYTYLPSDLQGADLTGTVFTYCLGHGVRFDTANLEGADLALANLRYSNFSGANLRGANLREASLNNTQFEGAHLEGADLSRAVALGASFAGATLDGARLVGIELTPLQVGEVKAANLRGASLVGVDLSGANLTSAFLTDAHLEGANLAEANLTEANLTQARLLGTSLSGATLAGAFLVAANLAGADLRGVTLDAATDLESAQLGDEKAGFALLGQTSWGQADLTVLDWALLPRIGEEAAALRARTAEGQPKDRATRISEHEAAIRALLALATALQGQGLREEASALLYRAQQLQRRLHALRGDGSRWAFATLLEALTGYGYRLQRMLGAYLVVVLACAAGYYLLGASGFPGVTPLPPQEALLVSITAFHGRVFTEQFRAGSPQLWVTAVEAIAGLVVEGLFIAMLTKRFFGD